MSSSSLTVSDYAVLVTGLPRHAGVHEVRACARVCVRICVQVCGVQVWVKVFVWVWVDGWVCMLACTCFRGYVYVQGRLSAQVCMKLRAAGGSAG